STAGPGSPRRTTSCRSSSIRRSCRLPTGWRASTALRCTTCTSACPPEAGIRAAVAFRYWLGIDIGGTFTDFSVFDTQTGTLTGLKVPSTPHEFAAAVRAGLVELAREHGIDPAEIGTVVHGTTIAVNTLIQRTGARLGLLVTDGFRDVL